MPELHWKSAVDSCRVIGEALGELVAHGEIDLTKAEALGESVLRGHVTRPYGL